MMIQATVPQRLRSDVRRLALQQRPAVVRADHHGRHRLPAGHDARPPTHTRPAGPRGRNVRGARRRPDPLTHLTARQVINNAEPWDRHPNGGPTQPARGSLAAHPHPRPSAGSLRLLGSAHAAPETTLPSTTCTATARSGLGAGPLSTAPVAALYGDPWQGTVQLLAGRRHGAAQVGADGAERRGRPRGRPASSWTV